MNRLINPKSANDWLSGMRFARFPIEVFSLNLTKNQLEVFLVILSYAGRDGNCGIHSPTQETIAEILGWYLQKVIPNKGAVNAKCAELQSLGLLSWTTPNGYDTKNIYSVHLPETAKLRATTDRSTPEYLAGAKAKRQEKINARNEKNKRILEDRAPVLEVESSLSDIGNDLNNLSDADFENALDFIDQSFKYDNPIVNDQFYTVREPDTHKVKRLLKQIADSQLKIMIESNIAIHHPKFLEYEGFKQLAIFKKIQYEEALNLLSK